jgi:hypothetical protein
MAPEEGHGTWPELGHEELAGLKDAGWGTKGLTQGLPADLKHAWLSEWKTKYVKVLWWWRPHMGSISWADSLKPVIIIHLHMWLVFLLMRRFCISDLSWFTSTVILTPWNPVTDLYSSHGVFLLLIQWGLLGTWVHGFGYHYNDIRLWEDVPRHITHWKAISYVFCTYQWI